MALFIELCGGDAGAGDLHGAGEGANRVPFRPMEYWGLDLSKENFKFSAAHFLIFPDGSAERLHGHNYRVFVEIDGGLDEHGLVLDLNASSRWCASYATPLTRHFIAPGEHPELVVGDSVDGHREVRYRESRYLMPEGDLIVLPVNNTSSENLATWLGRRLLEELSVRFPLVKLQRLKVSVERDFRPARGLSLPRVLAIGARAGCVGEEGSLNALVQGVIHLLVLQRGQEGVDTHQGDRRTPKKF